MSGKTGEMIAMILTLIGISAATVWPFLHQDDVMLESIPPGTPVITLTGMAATGTWTESEVTGSNYWRQDFEPARPVLTAGKTVLLRLKSADVMHAFYSPGLGVEPLDVYPGHVVEVLVTPQREGVFGYYCPTMCGDPHFGMRGVVIVQGPDGSNPPIPAEPDYGEYWLEEPPSPEAGVVEQGAWLFRQKGCQTCHGVEGGGGVPNWNYVKETVPELKTLEKRMFLRTDKEVEAIVSLIEKGIELETLEEAPPVRRFNVFQAQYESVRNVIRRGSEAGRKDPNGPMPPLSMPAWGQRLSDRDIDALIAYLLTL